MTPLLSSAKRCSKPLTSSALFVSIQALEKLKRHRVTIRVENDKITLGEYADPIYAAELYDACARYHFGEFAATNFEGTEKLNAYQVRDKYLADQRNKLHSPYVGVSKDGSGRFIVYVRPEGQTLSVGTFTSEVEAVKVHDAMVRFYQIRETKPNFEGNEKMSIDRARAYCRYLAYKEGRKPSRYRNVQLVPKVKDGNKWYALIKQDYGRIVLLDATFPSEREAAEAVDDVRAAYGLSRINFPDELQAA